MIWPQEKNGDFQTTCRRALQCALDIQSKLNNLEMSKGKILSVKVGLGFGKCKVLLVGGKFDRFECLVVGEAMRQACTSECHCKSGGETVISEDVYSQIEKYYDFVEAEPDTEHGPGDGLKYYKYVGKKTNDKIQTRADAFLMRTRFKGEDLKDKLSQLKTFVPAAITIYLDIEKEVWSKESRLVTIMFLNLTIDLKHTKTEDGLQYIQSVIKTVQNCIYRTRGSLNKFLMDDKGSVLLIAWGIPPISAHDDPIRAVLTGLNIINELKNIKNDKWGNCGAKIGITTGYCFSGVCGNIGNRREYSFLGEVVNLSARYMQQSMSMCAKENKKYQIVLCEKTKNLIQDKILCKWVAKGKCKGFSNEFNFYEPIEREEEPIPLPLIIKTHRDNPKIDIDCKLIPDFLDESMYIIGRDKEIKFCLEMLDHVCNSISCESKLLFITGIIGSGKSLFIRKVLYEFFEQNKKLRNSLPEMKKGNLPFLFVTRQLPTMLTTPYNGCCDFLKKIYTTISSRMKDKNIIVKLKDNLEVKADEFGEILVNNNYFQYITILNEIIEADILTQHFEVDDSKMSQIKEMLIPFEEPNLDKYFQKRNLKGFLPELHKFFIYLIEYYQKKCIKNLPFILIIEDTHLIDVYSIQLINLIHALPKTFIICTYQDSLNPYIKQEPPLLDIDEIFQFKGLADSKEIMALIANFCKKTKRIYLTSIEADALEAIIDHSFKNNPLFLIEVVDSLLNQGALVLEEGGKLVASPEFRKCIKILDWSKLTIPFLVEKVVGNIIDSLKCTEIITLKHACVIGAIFDIDKLNHLNIINKITRDDLIQMIYEFSEKGLVEILYDLNPKRIVAKFSIPFLKEILYKRMLVETKNEIHIKVARLMESSKFTYLPKEMENDLLNFHLMEEEKTILDHMDDTKDKEEQQILKDANLRIQVLKETTDKIKDIDLKTDEFGSTDLGGGIVSKRSMPIIKCGTIEKKSDKGITWENRFVIATKTKFYYWYTSEDYMNNKQYLGMFELKNIYDIQVLKDFEFSDKKNLMEVKVSSYYKKDILKGGRNYIFSVTKKNDLSAWVIALNFLRVKAIYDELRYSFGTINFPLNHEKSLMDKRREKRKFIFNKNGSRAYNSLCYNFGNALMRKKTDKKNSCFYLNQSTMNIEKKEDTENEIVSKLKSQVESVTTLTFGYFLGVIQSKLKRRAEPDDMNDEFEEPKHIMNEIKRNKVYKKIEHDYQKNLPRESESIIDDFQKKNSDLIDKSQSKKDEIISNKSDESDVQNNTEENNIKTGLYNHNTNVNGNNQQRPSNVYELDAKDKLQALSNINLKNDILDEQIKMMILGKK